MSSILSVGLTKVLARGSLKFPVLSSVRFISSKYNADLRRPKPYPYQTRDYKFPWIFLEDTEDRFNQNSKIIVVEGPIASGKNEFCKKLGEDLDMLVLPPANMDMFYKFDDFDWRSLDDEWSTENMKSFDEKTFCRNPKNPNSIAFQIRMLELRFSLYIDGLAHMLSTGQGVILQRCPFSDYIFVEAMDKCGYITKRAKDIYYEITRYTMVPLFKPHLVIYLDVSPAKVKENVKKRNNSWEINSPIFNDTYLNKIEDLYKNDYLPKISDSSELLVYDWSEGGDPEVVVEDIERIDFDHYDHFSNKTREWRELTTKEWNELRVRYADEKSDLMHSFNSVIRWDAPELIYNGDEMLEFERKVDTLPQVKYKPGFNPLKDNVAWKFGLKKDRNVYLW